MRSSGRDASYSKPNKAIFNAIPLGDTGIHSCFQVTEWDRIAISISSTIWIDVEGNGMKWRVMAISYLSIKLAIQVRPISRGGFRSTLSTCRTDLIQLVLNRNHLDFQLRYLFPIDSFYGLFESGKVRIDSPNFISDYIDFTAESPCDFVCISSSY